MYVNTYTHTHILVRHYGATAVRAGGMRQAGPVSRRRFDSEELVMMRRVTTINTRTIAPRQLARRSLVGVLSPLPPRKKERGRKDGKNVSRVRMYYSRADL